MDKPQAHIHMHAVKELLYDIDTAVGYIDKTAAIQTLEANAQGYLRQSMAIMDHLLETVEQLQKRCDRLVDAELRYVQKIEQMHHRDNALSEALEKSDADNERIRNRNREVCDLANERVGSMVKGLQAIVAYPKGEALVYVSEIKAIAATTLSTIEGGKATLDPRGGDDGAAHD